MKKQPPMRTLFVTFTCERDLPLLPLWAEAIRRAAARTGHPEPILLAAFHHTDPAALSPLPRGVRRCTTTWPRGGNLNGVPAITGILTTLYQQSQRYHCPVAVKVDTDTIITHTAWLELPHRTPQAGYIGLEAESPLSATGIAYAFRQDYLATLLSHIIPWPWAISPTMPEDRLICSLALMHTRAVLLPWQNGKYCAAFMPHYFTHPETLTTVSAAIHCGQAQALTPYGPHLQRTHLIRRQMITTLRALYHRQPKHPLPKDI